MAATWPGFLQDKLNQSGFSLSFQDNVVRSQTEIGPAKLRARSTKRIDTFTSTITIDKTQFQDWNDFFTVSLGNGVNEFIFNHPFKGTPATFRFTRPPKIDPLGGTSFTISMEWELLHE